MVKPDLVIAGDVVFAGIDEDDVSEIKKHSIVICFEDRSQFSAALRAGRVEFTVFGNEPGDEE